MEEAIAIGDREAPVTVDDLLAIHAVLMAGDERARPARVREEQNWIGGRLGNPSDAAFVPPPEDLVLPLLEDLVAFIAREDLPAVPQAAVAHAQFETVHPFVDGNGRVGRALVHVVLRRRGVAARFVPPVSIVLAARLAAYVEGLVAFREGRVGEWIASFAGAASRAALMSIELADHVASLQGEWRERAGRPRAGSAASKLIALLPALPVLSAPTVRAAIGVSQQQTLAALKALAEAGVIRQLSAGTYDRQRRDRAVRPARGVRGGRRRRGAGRDVGALSRRAVGRAQRAELSAAPRRQAASGADSCVKSGEAPARRPVSRVLCRGSRRGGGHPSGAAGCPTAHAADPRAGQRTSPPADRGCALLFGLAPGGVCRVSLRPTGAGIVTVALVLASRRTGVTRHPALGSSDFPHAARLTRPTRDRPAASLARAL